MAEVLRRKLPGVALKTNAGEVEFYNGRIIYASERVQWVQMKHPLHKLVYLMGETFLYWCERCKCDVWEQEFIINHFRGCPFCRGPVKIMGEGEKVRLHFRFAPDTSWSQWWAQRYEW